ncbi:N-acetylmuramoyl-L-alanine amidase [Paenibacillus sp. CMAA1364]
MKKFSFLLLLCVLFLVVYPTNSQAAPSPSKIILDGQEITMPDNVQVQIVNDNVMIPIRVVVENLKFKVDWNPTDKKVKIQQNSKVITLTVNKDEVIIDGKKINLRTAPQLFNSSVIVPIRFVSEQMGLLVSWDALDKTVYLTSNTSSSTDNGQASGDEKVDLPILTNPNKQEPTITNPVVDPTVNANVKVNRIEFVNNQLVVSMDGTTKANTFRLSNPDRIVVDFPNTIFADTFATIHTLRPSLQGELNKLDLSIYPNVKDVRYSIHTEKEKVLRVVIELDREQNFQMKEELVSNIFILDLNVPEDPIGNVDIPVIDSGRKVVVIDAGHGGSAPGSTSITGVQEKKFTLSIALKVQQLLLKESNLDVVMTRETDVDVSLSQRAQLANQLSADVFVSIHGNSNPSSSPNGTESYYYKRKDSKELAKHIHHYLIEATGLKDRGVKDDNFHVIRETTMPATLLEIGFLSNKADEAVLFTEDLQNRVAQAIVNGIKDYLNVGSN